MIPKNFVLAIGQEFRIPAASGTQKIRIDAIEGGFIYGRRFRARSSTWNKKPDKYTVERFRQIAGWA